MEIVGAAGGVTTNVAVGHFEREASYFLHFRSNTNNFRTKIEQLRALRTDMQTKVDAANDRNEVIKQTVLEWMTSVDVVLAQAKRLSDEAGTINKWFKGWCCFGFILGQTAQAPELSDQAAIDSSCCKGWCCARFTLGRRAKKDSIIIQGIYDDGLHFGTDVSDRKPIQNLKLVGMEDFSAFSSRDSTAEKIHKALLDDAINMVGVHGMPGVGKTTLIKEIAKQVKEERLFQEVVLVNVSQNPSLIKLQGDIAERLDLLLVGDNLSLRADQLFDRLNRDTTTLVILDDVWERIELSEVGIPYKRRENCCKVVFTTRDEGVCDRMEANATIKVAILAEEESWTLFQQKSRNVEDSSLARDILNECKGLPLAIVTLGLSLRSKDAIVWADTLVQLRKSALKGMSSVLPSIKLSYNFLESESIRICFLFCCFFPEDHKLKLDLLLSYMMGEKLLDDVDTYDEARGRLHSIVDILASSGMLLRDKEGVIMMHDVVRDVAISIATDEHGSVVKAGRNFRDWPDMELGNCMRLSMMRITIERLPTIIIKAPHLRALFLNDNSWLTELPPDIFADMKCLMTLDLSRTDLHSLPPSFSCLHNLCTLLLNYTSLRTLPAIDKLERLEILSLRNSLLLQDIPEDLGNLSNLRILDLSGTSLKNTLPSSILISKLHRLEVFHLNPRFFPYRADLDPTDFFLEVASLSRLTSLELRVESVGLPQVPSLIEIPGPWENLTRFQIMVNIILDIDFIETGFLRSLWLNEIRRKQVANWVLVLLRRTYYLKLYRCPDLESLTELGTKGMNDNLKSLHLWGCPAMECLVSNMGSFKSNENAFTNLEELTIMNMGAFVEICKGTPPPRLLCKLKKLTFRFCSSLLTAIPCKLLNLEYLEIEYCENLLYVLQKEEEESSQVSNMSRMSEPVLLPMIPNLKKIVIYQTKIRYVFTMNVARCLLQLEELGISCCGEMAVIFKYADGEDIKCDEEFKDSAILPCLKKLTVHSAPKLKSFTTHNLHMDLPYLETLEVYKCGILERLPFGTTSVPNLKTFDVFGDTELFDRLEWEDESVKSRLAVREVKKTYTEELRATFNN